jgi:hypothetical protein
MLAHRNGLCSQQFRHHRVGGEHFSELPKLAQPVYNPINGSNVYAFGVPLTKSPSSNRRGIAVKIAGWSA